MTQTKKLTLSAFFIALGIVLPFFTGQIPQIGNLLLPMHIPAMLCGFICGGPSGFLVGLITPILRSLLIGRPMMMPTAIGMAVELATYGLVSGLMYSKLQTKRFGIYISLLTAMIAGRITWGLISIVLYGILSNPFTWQYFMAETLLNSFPGIILQLILIPAIIYGLQRTHLHNNN